MSEIKINLPFIHTLDKASLKTGDFTDNSLYLHRNGQPVVCPFMTKAPAMVMCGTYCPHFDILKLTKKKEEGDTPPPSESVFAVITCVSGLAGFGKKIFLDNLSVDNNKEGMMVVK